MKFEKEMLLLYAVTDRAWVGEQSFLSQVEAALQGGVSILQLREKELSEEEFVAEALEVRALCRKYNVPLIINDDLSVAEKCGADGIHVGIEDISVAEIRQKMGRDFIIGATAKTPEQARAAEAAGADYLGVGAVFPSPTKQKAIRISREQLGEICGSVSIPAVAIGGITLENAAELRGGGMAGIAVVSSLFGAADIRAAAEALRNTAKGLVQSC